MIDRNRAIKAFGVEPALFAKRFGIKEFSVECRCGRTSTTSIPFASGALRGLMAPECPCGAAAPYAVVRADGGDMLRAGKR